MNRYGSEWHSLFRCRSRQAERYSGTGGGPCRTESMPMVIRQVAVGRYRPLFFRRSRACLSGMYFHAVSVVPYVPSRAAGGWRSGRTAGMPPVAVGGFFQVSSPYFDGVRRMPVVRSPFPGLPGPRHLPEADEKGDESFRPPLLLSSVPLAVPLLTYLFPMRSLEVS